LVGTHFAGSQFLAGTELALSAAFGDKLTFFATAVVVFFNKEASLVAALPFSIALQVFAQLFLAC